jgi:biopolymer transport protein ExbB
MDTFFLLQSDVVTDSLAAATEALGAEGGMETISIWEMIQNGGWYIMAPLGIMSIIAIYLFIERMLAISKAARVDKDFMNRIKDYIHDHKMDSAMDLCRQKDNPVSHMIAKGISKIGKPIKEISSSIENVGKLEIGRLEKGLSTIATIAGAAPMIGFLGTVIGMIQTFHQMKISPNGVEIAALSGGIMQAMVTTVAGLVIGIIAYICYNVLVTRVNKVVHGLEASAIDFLDVLDAPAN